MHKTLNGEFYVQAKEADNVKESVQLGTTGREYSAIISVGLMTITAFSLFNRATVFGKG